MANDVPERIALNRCEYVLGRHVGGGAFGQVYEAWQTRADGNRRRVVVKLLRTKPGQVHDREAVQEERFRREGRTGWSTESAHTIRVFDYGWAEDVEPETFVIVMESWSTRTLADVIRDDGPLPPDVVARVGWQVAKALAQLHDDARAVHRDVKTENLLALRDPDGQVRVRLIDMSLAKSWYDTVAITPGEEAAEETAIGVVLGTRGYMPPEAYDPDYEPRPPWDWYGLGVVLWECLLGVRRAQALNREQQLFDPPPVADLYEKRRGLALDAELGAAVDGLLRPLPRERLGGEDAVRCLEGLVQRLASATTGRFPGADLALAPVPPTEHGSSRSSQQVGGDPGGDLPPTAQMTPSQALTGIMPSADAAPSRERRQRRPRPAGRRRSVAWLLGAAALAAIAAITATVLWALPDEAGDDTDPRTQPAPATVQPELPPSSVATVPDKPPELAITEPPQPAPTPAVPPAAAVPVPAPAAPQDATISARADVQQEVEAGARPAAKPAVARPRRSKKKTARPKDPAPAPPPYAEPARPAATPAAAPAAASSPARDDREAREAREEKRKRLEGSGVPSDTPAVERGADDAFDELRARRRRR